METHLQPSIVALARQLDAARGAEREANEARIRVEQQIIDALKFELPEGSETYAVEDATGSAKLILKRPVNRSVDAAQWVAIRESLSASDAEDCAGLMRTKYDLALKEARDLEERRPTLWRKIAGCITAKPGKIQVELKELS